MKKDSLTYLKEISNAFRNYQDINKELDLNLLNKIYGYTLKIDDLNEDEKIELDNFIKENQFSINHIANIFLDKEKKINLDKRLKFMCPIALASTPSVVKSLKGKTESLKEIFRKEKSIKILCKTYPKAA